MRAVLFPQGLARALQFGFELLPGVVPARTLVGEGSFEPRELRPQRGDERVVLGAVRLVELLDARLEVGADGFPARPFDGVCFDGLLELGPDLCERALELQAERAFVRALFGPGLELTDLLFERFTLGGEGLAGAGELRADFLEPPRQRVAFGGCTLGRLEAFEQRTALGVPRLPLTRPRFFELGVVAFEAFELGAQRGQLRRGLGLAGAADGRHQAAVAARVALEHHRVDVRAERRTVERDRVEVERPGLALCDLPDELADVGTGRFGGQIAEVAAHHVARPRGAEQLERRAVHGEHAPVARHDHDAGRDVLDNLAEALLARARLLLLCADLDALVDAAQRRDQAATENPGLQHRVVGTEFERRGRDVGAAGRRQHDHRHVGGLRLY